MFGRPATALALGLLMAAPANAGGPTSHELANLLTEMGPTLGRIDYCGGGGQELFAAYAEGLDRFGLHPTERQALLAMTQAGREQARAEAARKFGGAPCPPEVRDVVQRARDQIAQGWAQIAQNAADLDLRPALARAMSAPPRDPAASQATPSAPAQAQAGLCAHGRTVEVLSAGKWYAAKVLDGPDRLGTCLVSYDGFASHFDEWVNVSRMRPASGAASSGGQPQTPLQVPPGTYSCYTFDSGQLNYTYTDVQILDSGRYAVGGKGGTYSLAAGGAMRFAGHLANATGRFSVRATGVPQIDLVFDGDARASMSCSKSR